MSDVGRLDVLLPMARATQDAALCADVGALLQQLARRTGVHAPCFERFTKPHWGLCLRVLGPAGALHDAEAWITAQLATWPRRDDEPAWSTSRELRDDKWLGRWSTWLRLVDVHAHDTRNAVAALRAEAEHRLGRSRTEASLLRVEGLLDALGVRAESRLEFYRQGYAWAFESGRWDAGMRRALEDRYTTLGAALRALLGAAPGQRLDCPGDDARLAGAWLDGVTARLPDLSSASAAERLELALCAARGHANRWGVHAVQEAVTCWLMERAWVEHVGGRS